MPLKYACRARTGHTYLPPLQADEFLATSRVMGLLCDCRRILQTPSDET